MTRAVGLLLELPLSLAGRTFAPSASSHRPDFEIPFTHSLLHGEILMLMLREMLKPMLMRMKTVMRAHARRSRMALTTE